jgi:hypothetical protein
LCFLDKLAKCAAAKGKSGGIMSLDDVDYYRRRALEERQRAARADDPNAANAHQELARHYEGLVARAEMLPLKRGCVANDRAT